MNIQFMVKDTRKHFPGVGVSAGGCWMRANFNLQVRRAEYLLKQGRDVQLVCRPEQFDNIAPTCIMD